MRVIERGRGVVSMWWGDAEGLTVCARGGATLCQALGIRQPGAAQGRGRIDTGCAGRRMGCRSPGCREPLFTSGGW